MTQPRLPNVAAVVIRFHWPTVLTATCTAQVVDLAFCIASQKHGGDSMPLESMAYLACHLEAITISWPAHV